VLPEYIYIFVLVCIPVFYPDLTFISHSTVVCSWCYNREVAGWL